MTQLLKKPLDVLIIEDSPDDARLTVDELARGGFAASSVRVSSRDQLIAALRERTWDLILCDYALPQFCGVEALKIVREWNTEVPFIYVSGAIGEETAIAAMHNGAQDYVMKDNLARLAPAVDRELKEATIRREAKLADDAMRESERKYRHLFESLTEAAFLYAESNNTIIDTNVAAETLLGLPREKIVGRRHLELYAGLPDEQFLQHIRAQNGEFEAQIKRGNGELVPVRVSLSQLRLHDRPFRLTLVRDITERHRLESQLREAQKMEAIGQLAGGIAHDFNNLLTIVTMQCALLQSELPDQPSAQNGLQQVLDAASRGVSLTRQLLTFSRREIREEMRPVDLGVLLGSMTKLLRRILSDQIEVDVRLTQGLPAVLADAGHMEQVLMNLVVNARDAMPNGGRLDIYLDQVDVGPEHVIAYPVARVGRFVQLSVKDSGCGIAPEVLPRIFEPFFTTKEVGKGTGLGLATVFGIVRQHHGWIEVESTVGGGTTFRVLLPASPKTAGVDAETSAAAPSHGGHETILFVEDEDTLRVLAVEALRREGYRVIEACTGHEALQRWKDAGGAVDLMITDLVMPGGLSGQKLAAELRTLRPDLKVIYSTGYSADIAGTVSIRSEWDYLPKPYSIEKLTSIVRRRFDEVPAAKAAE